jgi:transposase InsO family protein
LQKRELELLMRWRVVAYVRWARLFYRVDADRAAKLLGVSHRVVRSWILDRAKRRRLIVLRGRPAETLSLELRQLLAVFLWLMGPQTGVGTLSEQMPNVPRREIEAWLRRFRQGYWLGKESVTAVLRWSHRGAVWAMDFHERRRLIDGCYRYVLLVRDLASGNQLAALPLEEATAPEVANLLEALFVEHGAPLVIKCDNGSPFLTPEIHQLLARHGAVLLRSPPEYPRYNGACEAGVGSLKTRAHHIAARNGRPGDWTCDDVEEARLQANETARPLGRGSPTPDELWSRRATVNLTERGTFRSTVRMFMREVIYDTNQPPGPIMRRERAQMEREAVTRALMHHGYLTVARRRFTQPIPRRFRAGIR